MIPFEQIYREHPEAYEAMVSHEDYQGNILQTIQAIRPLDGLDLIDLGTGTGRLARLIAPVARSVLACDRSAPMLRVAQRRLREAAPSVWRLARAENRRLPVASATADMAMAGWSLGHTIEWHPETWRDLIEATLQEMRRALRPGGTLLILETLGTGEETPRPPSEGLARYYELLEREHGFERRWARTDYAFDTPQQAAERVRFFFGDALADRLLEQQASMLPECTGFWYRTI